MYFDLETGVNYADGNKFEIFNIFISRLIIVIILMIVFLSTCT